MMSFASVAKSYETSDVMFHEGRGEFFTLGSISCLLNLFLMCGITDIVVVRMLPLSNTPGYILVNPIIVLTTSSNKLRSTPCLSNLYKRSTHAISMGGIVFEMVS